MSNEEQKQEPTQQVFSDDELVTFADELFNLETLVARVEQSPAGEQLELDVQPGVKRDDAAYDSMMTALRVSQQYKRKRGQRGGTSLHNQLRQDLQKAWVVMGGWRFVVACVASKDPLLMRWALDLFTKAGMNAGALQNQVELPGAEADTAYRSFIMALQDSPADAEAFTQQLAQVDDVVD